MADSFKYIFVPADVTEPIQQWEMVLPEGKEVECLLDRLKDHFARAGGPKTEEQKKAQKENWLRQLGPGADKVDANFLEAATSMNMVENISLLANSPSSGFVGVNMYCDDEAQIKNLPLNPRASEVAQCCGKRLEVHGDAFLARVFDNEDSFKRMDLLLSEVSSNATWVREAAEQARKRARNDNSQDFLDKLKEKQRAKETTVIRELTQAEVEKEEGNVAVKAGDWHAAVDHYSAALILDPSLIAALNNRALAYLKLEKHEDAERDASEVLKAEPGNVKALLRRATAREALGRAADALTDCEGAQKLQPGNKEALAGLSRLRPTVAESQEAEL